MLTMRCIAFHRSLSAEVKFKTKRGLGISLLALVCHEMVMSLGALQTELYISDCRIFVTLGSNTEPAQKFVKLRHGNASVIILH